MCNHHFMLGSPFHAWEPNKLTYWSFYDHRLNWCQFGWLELIRSSAFFHMTAGATAHRYHCRFLHACIIITSCCSKGALMLINILGMYLQDSTLQLQGNAMMHVCICRDNQCCRWFPLARIHLVKATRSVIKAAR